MLLTRGLVRRWRGSRLWRGTEGQGKAKRFSTPEVDDMKLYFVCNIVAGEVLTIAQCRAFVGDHNSNKTAKQVRDKLRNLIRRK